MIWIDLNFGFRHARRERHKSMIKTTERYKVIHLAFYKLKSNVLYDDTGAKIGLLDIASKLYGEYSPEYDTEIMAFRIIEPNNHKFNNHKFLVLKIEDDFCAIEHVLLDHHRVRIVDDCWHDRTHLIDAITKYFEML